MTTTTTTTSGLTARTSPRSTGRPPVTTLSLPALVLLLLLLVALGLPSCSGQQYHFSNGWYPGKKRSAPSTSSLGGLSGSGSVGLDNQACGIRSETMAIISRLLQEETARIQRNCIAESQLNLRDLLERARGKMSSDKW